MTGKQLNGNVPVPVPVERSSSGGFNGREFGAEIVGLVRGYLQRELADFDARLDARLEKLRERIKAVESRSHLRFAGQYREGSGKVFEPNDLVSSGGSLWICCRDTSVRPTMGNDAWELLVRKGKDGKNTP